MWQSTIFYTVKPCGVEPSSCLLSNENGGMRHSNVLLSCRSILNVPLSTHMHTVITWCTWTKRRQNGFEPWEQGQFENATEKHNCHQQKLNKHLTEQNTAELHTKFGWLNLTLAISFHVRVMTHYHHIILSLYCCISHLQNAVQQISSWMTAI